MVFASWFSDGLKDILTYQPLVDTLVAVIPIVIAGMFKRVREAAAASFHKLVKTLLNGSDHSPNSDTLRNLMEVQSELAILREKTNATRVCIYQFHNGEEFSLANPIFKFSCTSESDKPGVRPDAKLVKNYLVASYVDLFAPLSDDAKLPEWITEVNGCNAAKKTKGANTCTRLTHQFRILRYDIKNAPYGAFRFAMEEQGVEVLYVTLLYTVKHKPIGVICFQYIDADDDKFNETPVCEICGSTMRIQYRLTNS